MATFIEKMDLYEHVLNNPRFMRSEVTVLFAIIRLTNLKRDDSAWPSHDYLAQRCDLSRKSVIRAIAGLVRDKILIKTHAGHGPGNTNSYVLSEKLIEKVQKKKAAALQKRLQGNSPTRGTISRPVKLSNSPTRGTINSPTRGTLTNTLTKSDSFEATKRLLLRKDRAAPLRGVDAVKNQPWSVAPGVALAPIQQRKLTLDETKAMSRSVRLELNAELDELLEHMLPVYNGSTSGGLDMGMTSQPDGSYRYGKDRGKIWGAYIYARVDYMFTTLRDVVEDFYAQQTTIAHPATWLMRRLWLPKELQPKVLGIRKLIKDGGGA